MSRMNCQDFCSRQTLSTCIHSDNFARCFQGCKRYDSREGGARVAPGRLYGHRRYDYMDVIGRVEPGAETESDLGSQRRAAHKRRFSMGGVSGFLFHTNYDISS